MNLITVLYNHNLLSVIAYTCVDLEDVIADEPDKVGKVWHGRFVDDKL